MIKGRLAIIPPMTHPYGQHWEQPETRDIAIDDTHALMNEGAFLKLPEYSSSFPTGVYPGKMWRRNDGLFDRTAKLSDRRWLLCWYGSVEEDGTCPIEFREIIVV